MQFTLTQERIFAISLGLLVSILAIDGRSLWIDEFGTWLITQQNSFAMWWHAFLRETDSDGQLPFYHLYMYLWSGVFGTSELALRLANAPWFMLATWGLTQAPLSARVRACWLAILGLHAFSWYYLNEARPYVLFIAGTSLASSGSLLIVLSPPSEEDDRRGVALFCAGCTLLLGASILGALWVASLTLALLWGCRDRLNALLRAVSALWWFILPCFFISIAIFVIAVMSFMRGARAAAMGFSPLGIIYGLIETLGLSGLGPGRNELRMGAGPDVSLPVLCMLLASGLASLVVLRTMLRLPRNKLVLGTLAVLGPIVALAVLGQLLSMRIVGRHFAFVLVPMTLAFALAFAEFEFRLSAWNAALAVLAGSLLASSLLIRFSATHQKDNYARAAQEAVRVTCAGGSAWWAADRRGAAYYGVVPLAKALDRSASEIRRTPGIFIPYADRQIGSMPEPTAIFLSKPETYDADSFVRGFMKDKGYREAVSYPGFSVLARDENYARVVRAFGSSNCVTR